MQPAADMGVARVTFVGLDSLRNTDPIMDLLTRYRLRDHLAEEKFRLELSTLMENDPAHQHQLEQWTHRINVLLAEVRGEVAAREVPGARSSVTTQEFETYVHDVLNAYNALDVIHAAEAQRTA